MLHVILVDRGVKPDDTVESIAETCLDTDATRAGRWSRGCRSVDDAMRILTDQARAPTPKETVILDEGEQASAAMEAEIPVEEESDGALCSSDGESSNAEEIDVPAELCRQAGVSASVLARSFRAPASEGDKYFRHSQSGVVHVARNDHPDDEGECTTFKCGRVANLKYEALPSFVHYFEKKCSGCWA